MTDALAPRPKMHGLIAGAAVAWNLMGLLMFVLQVSIGPEQLAAMAPADRAVYEATPGWLTAAFGLAVGAGLAGSVGLLGRRRWAPTAFALSLVALLVQFIGAYGATPAWEAYGFAGTLLPAMLVAITVLLLRYARRVS
ncbi:hypothetical protein [Luteitalea sp.]|uniref:hypothetical protein n=1 Tax=Luteitalea sp. TaxID=2004800 RepID=UPI0025C4F365|nr:hypothetical protein [Luteitalea sp.]